MTYSYKKPYTYTGSIGPAWYEKLEAQIRKLQRAKHKLQRKTMNVDAFYDLWDRFIDEFPVINFRVHFVNLLVNIPDFKFNLDLFNKFKKLFGYSKAIYGESYYGSSYVDPTNWLKFVTEFKRYVFTKGIDYASARGYIEGFAKVANLYTTYLHDTTTRIQLFIPLILDHTVCGFMICGKSRLADTRKTLQKEGVLLEYATTLYQLFKTKVTHAVQAHFAHICGLTPCGFSRCIPRDVYLCNLFAEAIKYQTVGYSAWRNAIQQVSRFLTNITGIKLLEGSSEYYSPKMETYFNKMLINVLVDNIVSRIVDQYSLDPMKKQLCMDLGRELVFGYIKKHTLYRKAVKYLEFSEYVEYLIEKYSHKGLDKEIIIRIIDDLLLFAEYFVDMAKTRYFKR